MNLSWVSGAMGFLGVVLMAFAGIMIADYDLRTVVVVVAISVVASAALVELVARGFWR